MIPLTLRLALVFLLSLVVTSGHAQSGLPKTEQAARVMLCTKWKIVSLEAQGKKMVVQPGMGETYMVLKPDGTFTEIEDNISYKGKWTYNHISKVLFTDDKDGKQNNRVIKLTPDKLVIYSPYQGMPMPMTITLARVK